MKTQNVIRLLAGLTFLIFFCPFFQMCSDESITKFPFRKEKIEETTISQSAKSIETAKEKLQEDKDKSTFSGYRMATYLFEPDSLKDFDANDLLDAVFYAFLSFSFTLIISLIVLVQSLRKKFSSVYKLSLFNLLFATIPLLIFIFDGTIEDIAQIKSGYYLFTINIVALITISKKAKNSNALANAA